MSWYDRAIAEDVTYWAPSSRDGYGVHSYQSPQVLKGRLEQRTEKFYDDQGAELHSDSVAFLRQSVQRSGYLARGDQSGTSDPTTLHEAFEITETREQRDLSGRITTHLVLLQRASRPG